MKSGQIRATIIILILVFGLVGLEFAGIFVGFPSGYVVDLTNDVSVSLQNSYDLFGRKVNASYKGIIIKNGKKVINK